MKKIILAVILLAAAGGAVYYYYQTKKQVTTSVSSYQQTIIGDWKIDSVAARDSSKAIWLLVMALDSNLANYHFQFKEDGSITQMLGDSIVPVKRGYEWKDSASLIFTEGDSLTEKHPVQILSLSKEQFSMMNADSSIVYFKKQVR
jgi:hypothetical protein